MRPNPARTSTPRVSSRTRTTESPERGNSEKCCHARASGAACSRRRVRRNALGAAACRHHRQNREHRADRGPAAAVTRSARWHCSRRCRWVQARSSRLGPRVWHGWGWLGSRSHCVLERIAVSRLETRRPRAVGQVPTEPPSRNRLQSRMSPHLAGLLLAIVPLLRAIAQGDPLTSPECQAARAELDQAIEQAGAGRAPGDRLGRRTRTRRRCVPGRQRSRPRALRCPRSAAAGAAARHYQRPRLVAAETGTAPPPLAIPRPTVITTCDPSGCWDSEGRRLNSAPPALMGPRGLCSGTGSVVNCP